MIHDSSEPYMFTEYLFSKESHLFLQHVMNSPHLISADQFEDPTTQDNRLLGDLMIHPLEWTFDAFCFWKFYADVLNHF